MEIGIFHWGIRGRIWCVWCGMGESLGMAEEAVIDSIYPPPCPLDTECVYPDT